jgi:TolA-binding protein
VKRSCGVLQSLPLIVVAALFSSCSSSPEKTAQEEYFVPVDSVVRQKVADEAALKVVARARGGVRLNEGEKDTILDMIREQNRRLDIVSRQLDAMTQNAESSSVAQRDEHLRGLLSDRSRMTNQLLSEMIKEQNQRLNEIIAQLNTLLQNQRALSQNAAPLAEVAAAPVPAAAPASTPRRLDASLSYGKAIELYQTRQYEKAIRALGKLCRRSGDPALGSKCRFWIGVCRFNLGRLDEAMAAFRDVLGRGSEKAEGARFMMGQCYERMGQKKLALETYEELLRRYPAGKMKQVVEIKLALLR